MNQTTRFTPVGTLIYGKAALAQLPYEMKLAEIKNPLLISSQENFRRARKVIRLLNAGYFKTISISTKYKDNQYDALLLAGGNELLKQTESLSLPRILVPQTQQDLESISGTEAEFLVIDSKLIRNKTVIELFFKRLASSLFGNIIHTNRKLTIPSAFTFTCRTTVLSGHNTLEKLPEILLQAGVRSPLVLSDQGIDAVGLLDKLKEKLSDIDIRCFTDIPPDSDSHTVNKISAIYRQEKRDGIIAMGGGSVLDTSKGVYMNVSLGTGDLSLWSGSNRIPKMETPFFVIPTTSGTGSEVTKVAVISDKEKGRKILYVSPNLAPDYAFLDSSLTASLPPFLTSITGMDALSHAVEAYTCLGKNPLSDLMAYKAIELISQNLIKAMDSPADKEIRLNLALASNLAGLAFSNSMVGMVHTIGHSVGAVCHVPHGSCMSVLLPFALDYNYEKINNLLKELLPAFIGKENAQQIPETEQARKTIETIREMNRTLRKKTNGRHPERFRQIVDRDGASQVTPEDFEKIARTSLGDASIVYNPVDVKYDDIIKVLEKSYS